MDFYSSSFDIWFEENIRSDCNSYSLGLNWNVYFVVICWALWKRRCSSVFNGGHDRFNDIVKYCNRVGMELSIVHAASSNVVVVRSVYSPWCKLAAGWVRVNADGAVSGSDGRVATGGVLRDDSGKWLFGFSRSLGICSVLIAEVWAAHDARMHAW
ncbi:hypothetical protein GQ457_17G016800 [Hibiscus cannabinus]